MIFIGVEAVIVEGPIADHNFGLAYTVEARMPFGSIIRIDLDQSDIDPMPDRVDCPADTMLVEAARELCLVVRNRFEGMEIAASVPRELRRAIDRVEALLPIKGEGMVKPQDQL